MTSDKTQGEGNRLIAEFDGWQSNKYHNLPNKLHKMEAGEEVGISINQLEYHSSWDALMPVLKKIGDLQSKKESVALWDNIVVGLSIISIKLTWRFAIEFIQWYNTNSK